MVHFVGAGPGAPDLITLRGAELVQKTDIVIYAGSLVNPALLGLAKEGCKIYNSAEMTLEQVLDVMKDAQAKGLDLVRLHTGDPCLYGAIREQMDGLDALGIPYDDTPGVSSFHTLLRRLLRRCLEILLLGTAIMTPPLGEWAAAFQSFLRLLKKLTESRETRIPFLLTPARFYIQVNAAAGTKALTILHAEIFAVHLQHEGLAHQRARVQLVPLQQNDVILLLLPRQLCGEQRLELDDLVPLEGLGTAVAVQMKRCFRPRGEHQRSRHVPHLPRHLDQLLDRPLSPKGKLRQIQREIKRKDRAGNMDDVFQIKSHGTPRTTVRLVL